MDDDNLPTAFPDTSQQAVEGVEDFGFDLGGDYFDFGDEVFAGIEQPDFDFAQLPDPQPISADTAPASTPRHDPFRELSSDVILDYPGTVTEMPQYQSPHPIQQPLPDSALNTSAAKNVSLQKNLDFHTSSPSERSGKVRQPPHSISPKTPPAARVKKQHWSPYPATPSHQMQIPRLKSGSPHSSNSPARSAANVRTPSQVNLQSPGQGYGPWSDLQDAGLTQTSDRSMAAGQNQTASYVGTPVRMVSRVLPAVIGPRSTQPYLANLNYTNLSGQHQILHAQGGPSSTQAAQTSNPLSMPQYIPPAGREQSLVPPRILPSGTRPTDHLEALTRVFFQQSVTAHAKKRALPINSIPRNELQALHSQAQRDAAHKLSNTQLHQQQPFDARGIPRNHPNPNPSAPSPAQPLMTAQQMAGRFHMQTPPESNRPLVSATPKANFTALGTSTLGATPQGYVQVGPNVNLETTALGTLPVGPAQTGDEIMKQLREQLKASVDSANTVYLSRGQDTYGFYSLYPKVKQNIIQTLFGIMSHVTGLYFLPPSVWTVGDEQLGGAVSRISQRLKRTIPRVQDCLRELIKDLADEEFHWTAISQAISMVYNSFSCMKAALAQRDKNRSERVESFIKLLDLDRRVVMQMMLPPSDAELTAAMSEETAKTTRRTAQDNARMQVQYDQQQMQRRQEMEAEVAAQRQQADQA
jgi:hypothetical protein